MKRATMVVVTLMALAACGGDPASPLEPFQPEINSAPDNFQLQATGVTDVGTTLEYSWENTGSQAVVDHSTITTTGLAAISIADANGIVVYSHGLVESLNEDTATGASGSWTITVQLSSYSGTLNFRVQKKP